MMLMFSVCVLIGIFFRRQCCIRLGSTRSHNEERLMIDGVIIFYRPHAQHVTGLWVQSTNRVLSVRMESVVWVLASEG